MSEQSDEVGERAAHAVFDAAAGVLTFVAQADQELAESQARAAAWQQEQAQRVAEDEQIRALAAAHQDPLVRLLAQRAGVA